jgi:hypothetical protein
MPISKSGVYRIDVLQPNNNPTYLHDAVYRVEVSENYAHFTNLLTGSGTGDSINLLNAFEKQRRVSTTFLRTLEGN